MTLASMLHLSDNIYIFQTCTSEFEIAGELAGQTHSVCDSKYSQVTAGVSV